MASVRDGNHGRIARLAVGLGLAAAMVTASVVPAAAEPAAATTSEGGGLDQTALRQSLDAVTAAGMYGIYSDVRDTPSHWQGAAGVADVETRRPVRPDMRHRVGSITKTFTAVAILQQVGKGAIELDAPIGRYLPDLVPGERGQRVTVRMLLNHTSGIGDYIVGAFPSLAQMSAQSLDDNRFRRFQPEELVKLGLDAPPTGDPGARFTYSNTNYIIAGLLLEKVTGTDPERYITRNVIAKAGLKHTSFPRTPHIPGPHSKAYESLFGIIDPPRDYSVYDMSWGGTAGALVSTMDDLNRFYRVLLSGKLLSAAQLAQMQTTVAVTDGQGNALFHYGLGIYAQDLPCGRFWGHDGGVFGMGTVALSSPDGSRQLALGFNLMKYQRVSDDGTVVPHPIDAAIGTHALQGLCGPTQPRIQSQHPWVLFPTSQT